MTKEETDKILDEHQKDIQIRRELEKDGDMIPHYVYVSAVLLDGEILQWKVGLTPLDLFTATINLPEELRVNCDNPEKYLETASDFGRRLCVLNLPFWVENLEGHNLVYEESPRVFKNYKIHKNFEGMMPY